MESDRKVLLQTLAARLNARETVGLETFFSEDFVLHQPGRANLVGHDGARAMIAGFDGFCVDPLDMIEEGERVAVRWAFSGRRDGAAIEAACVAIYRFERGLIAEDWGVVTAAPWA